MPFTASMASMTRPFLFGLVPKSVFDSHLGVISLLDRRKNNANWLLSVSPPKSSAKFVCSSAKHQSGPVKKRPSPTPNSKRKKKPNSKNGDNTRRVTSLSDVEVLEQEGGSFPMPKPPAGFVIDEQGRVLLASNKRITTIIDPTNNFPLECVIRRIFRSDRGDECMLLLPVDMPVQILKSTNVEGWSAVSDEEVEAILPTAAYALAKIHMHLVYSGFCYTARGGFCYTEDDIFEFRTDDGQDVDGLPTEGIEITCFHMEGSHYMIYTPSDPLLFVAVKDENGVLRIADDEILDDPAIVSAIDEETEFNALAEEEAALIEGRSGTGTGTNSRKGATVASGSSSRLKKSDVRSWIVTDTVSGGPKDGSVIPNFNGHVASLLWQGTDRGCLKLQNIDLVCQMLTGWKNSLGFERARPLVKTTKLSQFPGLMFSHNDIGLCTLSIPVEGEIVTAVPKCETVKNHCMGLLNLSVENMKPPKYKSGAMLSHLSWTESEVAQTQRYKPLLGCG
ncbi:OLC1v1008629C1 [Oldenlandia corymbosa var. corymbosa]|uniref:OLC1v1008629C1 n=1 Tax=Oldenlandia corymbosa var. corymbosa TaxID=529605 RepID=A0AAV1DPJ4_OLDCO|nr:OLC1v1008629C1 [Oldenlandia corymbosa var. corymbosa]